MSLGIESNGIVAGAVRLSGMMAFGPGWAAWNAGKLLVGAGISMKNDIDAHKEAVKEQAKQRKRMAIAAHEKMMEMCRTMLSEIEAGVQNATLEDAEILECLRWELHSIAEVKMPEDAEQIESINAKGFAKLDAVVMKKAEIASMRVDNQGKSRMDQYAFVDLMNDFRISIMSTQIKASKGVNITAPDPAVLERGKLNEELMSVIGRVTSSIEHVRMLADEYGLSESSHNWLQSCLNGTDESIRQLSDPAISNKELKKGIKRLEEMIHQYDISIASIDKECAYRHELYKVYVEASKALGELPEKKSSFKSTAELEERLEELKVRNERAQECAEIYEALGRDAYICYAWDQELSALGYSVHSRREIIQKTGIKPERATHEGVKIPFYEWSDDALTQLYSITDKCDLQVVVNSDGTVSMQTIAVGNEDVKEDVQKSHCSKMARLHENLKKNWFLLYDFEEKTDVKEAPSYEMWTRSSIENEWRNMPVAEKKTAVTNERQRKNAEKQTMHKKQ